jgi:hypothetical protein
MSEVYIAIERSDGSVVHLAVATRVRAPTRPRGPGWTLGSDGVWVREVSSESLAAEVRRDEQRWKDLDNVTMVRWRTLTKQEHDWFEDTIVHARYRDSVEWVGDEIRHNMPKARELHRHLIRHQRGEKMVALDGQWMRAIGQGNTSEAARIDTERQALRDATDNPVIDSATTVSELMVLAPLDIVPSKALRRRQRDLDIDAQIAELEAELARSVPENPSR